MAREGDCPPVEVGEGTGVYFMALSDTCGGPGRAEGYTVIAHLARDDDLSEVLVLVDAEHGDAETVQVARLLAERVKDGSIDGVMWHDQPAE
jgi:predicted RNA-binding protein with TRAM domain